MKKILGWGTGNVARELFECCPYIEQYEIIGIVDNDINKQGQSFFGIEILPPSAVAILFYDAIVVMSDAFDDIYDQVARDYPHKVHLVENQFFFYKNSVLKRYNGSNDVEILKVIRYIKEHGLHIFNYPFVEKYKTMDVEVFKDITCNLYYVVHNEKRMYFSRSFTTEESVKEYYRQILLEQDELSPHRYLKDDFSVESDDVVVDLGAAEGFFALDTLDKAKKLYVVEMDSGWIEALEHTFAPYMDKVIIIKCAISSIDDAPFSKLDTLIEEPVNFIKMDIEGFEWDALLGAEKTIEVSKPLKLCICAYHSDFDEILIKDFMDNHNISYSVTSGFIWFPYMRRQTWVSTRLNRGVVRGRK